jgi:hypothetical protein
MLKAIRGAICAGGICAVRGADSVAGDAGGAVLTAIVVHLMKWALSSVST